MSSTLPNILAALEQLNSELSTEGRLVRVGLKDEQQTAAILKKFDWLCRADVLQSIQQERDAAADSETRELRDRLRARGYPQLQELSMGMTHDFPVAIEEGATMVRIGTALFGPRPAPAREPLDEAAGL